MNTEMKWTELECGACALLTSKGAYVVRQRNRTLAPWVAETPDGARSSHESRWAAREQCESRARDSQSRWATLREAVRQAAVSISRAAGGSQQPSAHR